jgi:hypothetical protein
VPADTWEEYASRKHFRAAHAAQRSKRPATPLTPLRCVRGSEMAFPFPREEV